MLKIIYRVGYAKADYLKKIHYFKYQGKHCYFQPYNFGTEPELMSFGDNDHVASKVMFINYDITSLMFEYMDDNE